MKTLIALGATLTFVVSVSSDTVENSAQLRMNQIQVIGTHNSYHAAPSEPLFSQVKAVYPDAATWAYDHPPLDQQLDHGVRSFELDLYYDPNAIRVFHVPRFDMNATCETLVDCATVLRDWSQAHPNHVPIIVLLELKVDEIPQANMPVLPFDALALAQLEKEVLSVFEESHLLRPDDVRGDAPTLIEAIETTGWPKLDDVRGRVMFVLHTGGKAAAAYAEGHATLENRAFFLQAYGDEAYAAVYVMNNPQSPEIPAKVKAGYIVRTRADGDLKEAQENDTSRREAAFASGAQIITTDFPNGEAHAETGYQVVFEGGVVARRNAAR